MERDVGFALFLTLWNRMQGQSTPAVHYKIATWLAAAWAAGDTRLLLMAFRSCGKSTIVGLFAAWLLWRRPDLRIMVLAADNVLARKMVRNVKRIIERHVLTQGLKPERLDQWGADRFTVRRHKELRDPSMMARGIATNMTGSRADIIICDDVEVPKTCDSAEKRAGLRELLAEIDFVLSPGGTQLYVGTPHSWYTIYAAEARAEIAEEMPFLNGFSRLVVPLTDEAGVSAWPERFPPEEIAAMKRRSGPNRFASQMLLRPVNISEGRLDPVLLQRYDAKLSLNRVLGGLFLGERRIVACSAYWDPSFGKAGGDASVFAVLFTDEDGDYWLQRLDYIQNDPFSPDDEATQQCRKVAFAAQLMNVPCVAIESNGIGQFLPGVLRKELARLRVPSAIKPVHNSRSKDVRILESFDAVMAARALHVHESVYQTPFIREMQEWAPGHKGGHDDGLDAVAGALMMAPVRIRHDGFAGRQEWMGSGKTLTVRSDFDV
ncbi:MAG: phage terminase large subunit [Alphaproteobacteria bacterium]|nr:phage terminase large subunit [Alphaproteobacteria bacterium]